MKFNFKNTDSCHWLIDEYDMVVCRKFPYDVYPNIGNAGDAMCNNSICTIAYENKNRFVDGLVRCIDWDGDTLMWRHPLFLELNYGRDTSRDQVLMFIVAMKIINYGGFLGDVLQRLKYRLSDKFTQRIDFWLWQKSIKHNSKWIASAYIIIELFLMAFLIPFNKLLRRIAGIKDISQKEYIKPYNEDNADWKIKMYWKLRFPAYALDKFVWQLYVMPKVKILSWVLKKLVLCDVAKTSLTQRMLLGKRVSKEEIDNYRPMGGYRWSHRYTNVCTLPFLNPKYTENLKDKAMVNTVFKMTQE